MNFTDKKKKIIASICATMDTLDPSKTNSARYRKLLEPMDEKQFANFISYIKNKKLQIFLVMPNQQFNLEMDNIKKAAKDLDIKLFKRLWLYNKESGKKYLTNIAYPILQQPARRMEQFLDNKMKVPNDDKTIDGLTGQVSGSDAKSSFSTQETRVTHARGLDRTLVELLKIRGGDISTYGEFRRQLEETGSCNTDNIISNTRVKSGHSLNVFLKGMGIDNNF